MKGDFSMIARVLALGLAIALAGAPAVAQDRAALIARGQKLFTAQGCYGCHTVGKVGTPIASDLSRVGGKYQESYLLQWLRDPATQKPTAHMPKIAMTEMEARALAAYLASLQ
jgi:mono/diheme cytochrome c family protein